MKPMHRTSDDNDDSEQNDGQAREAAELNAVEEEVKAVMRCAPEAVSASKELIAAVEGRPSEEVHGETIERLARTWETESCRQGIAAFLEKRKPPWISGKK